MNRPHLLALILCVTSATVVGALLLWGFAWLAGGASAHGGEGRG